MKSASCSCSDCKHIAVHGLKTWELAFQMEAVACGLHLHDGSHLQRQLGKPAIVRCGLQLPEWQLQLLILLILLNV